MKQTAILPTTSLLSIVLATFHLADDIARGFEKQLSNHTDGAFFFAWRLLALGATARFSALLAARALRSARRDREMRTA